MYTATHPCVRMVTFIRRDVRRGLYCAGCVRRNWKLPFVLCAVLQCLPFALCPGLAAVLGLYDRSSKAGTPCAEHA